MVFVIGDRVTWYDYRLWGPKDYNGNAHCYKPATVVGVDPNGDGPGKPTVDLLFDHNPNVSHGHFAYGVWIGRRAS